MKPSTPTVHEVAPPRASRIADLFAPATVVLFAGCGGTCIGIEQAYVDGGFSDKYVDLAINHWDTAVGVHELSVAYLSLEALTNGVSLEGFKLAALQDDLAQITKA